MSSAFRPSERLNLPGYPFAELERKAAEIKKSGRPLFDLSIGDPDLPPPEFVTRAVMDSLSEPNAHRYPSSRGHPEVRAAVARWFKGRFGVELDPERQVCILIGAKEGLAQLARAVVNPGDPVGVPDPGYPVYGRSGAKFVDGRVISLRMEPGDGYLPNLKHLPPMKLVYLNYPNNPTGAEAPASFLADLARYADEHPAVTVAYDMAYSEVTFGAPSRSLLEFTGNAVEFHSLSKMANVTGYRVGFAVGDATRITALVRVKEEVDSGVPLPFQRALQATLESYDGPNPPPEMRRSLDIIGRRREHLADAIQEAGYELFRTNATLYLWFRVGGDERSFVERALNMGLLLTPGSGFGPAGRGWVRASVTAPDEAIAGAAITLKSI